MEEVEQVAGLGQTFKTSKLNNNLKEFRAKMSVFKILDMALKSELTP